MVLTGIPSASAAAAAARALATLYSASPPKVTGRSATRATRCGRRPAQQDQPAALNDRGTAAAVEGKLDVRVVGVQGERVPAALRLAAHAPGPRIVRIEDNPSRAFRDASHRALHLGQLVERVDPLQAQVIGRDVGHHRHVVCGVPDPAQQDPATGRLEHGQLEPRLGEDAAGTAVPGPVPRFDQLRADVDPIRVGHPHLHSCRGGDVRDQPGGGALPVRARDRHDRDTGPRQVGHRAGRHRSQRAQLMARGAGPRRDPSRGGGDGLRARAPAPRERDRSAPVVVRVANGHVRGWKIERDVEPPNCEGRGRGHVRGGEGRVRPEFELDGRSIEEPIGAVQHAQLEQLDLGLRPRVVRHGRQYTHAP